jgi:mRNA interferase MazF
MVTIAQGDVWWVDLGDQHGSEPSYQHPVVVVQGNSFNRSRISTVLCVPLTSNLKWADAPGNVLLTAKEATLPKESVANVSQLNALDRAALTERVGRIPSKKLALILSGIDVVLGL